MNSYSKLVEIIGQKRAVIDKLRAELAPMEEVLALLERDYDEISALRLRVRAFEQDHGRPVPPPEPEVPAPSPAASAPVVMPPPTEQQAPKQPHVTKQQRIVNALAVKPMTTRELREMFPDIKSMESSLKVLRDKKLVLMNDSVLPHTYSSSREAAKDSAA